MAANSTFHSTKLANGLTVLGERRPSAKSVALGFFVRTGARDETSELSGVSHFLEHMVFKGTATRSALDVSYQLGAIGAQANAFTSEENTVYYLAVLPEYLEKAFELLSDMLVPALDEGEFNMEKKVILEEIALYQDNPTHVLFESAVREFFGGHPAGNSVLGSIASVSGITQPQMKEYYQRRYSAQNIVLTASGNFDWDKILDLAQKYCSHWPSIETGRDLRPHVATSCTRTITKEDLNRAHRCFIAPGPSADEEERYATHVLSVILGDSSGSRAFWELVDKGLADSASVSAEEMDGTGFVYGYISATPERLDDVGAILQNIIESPRKFNDEDLRRAVTKIRTRTVLQGESSMRRLMAVGLEWIYRGTYTPLAEEIKKLELVDKKSIEKALEKYSFAPTAVVSLIPA